MHFLNKWRQFNFFLFSLAPAFCTYKSMRSFLSDALINASYKKRTHASSRLSEPLQTLYQTHYSNLLLKKLWQHYLPRWIFCPSPKDEIRIRLQLHCPLSRFCTAIVDVSPFSSPFDGAQRYILTLSLVLNT